LKPYLDTLRETARSSNGAKSKAPLGLASNNKAQAVDDAQLAAYGARLQFDIALHDCAAELTLRILNPSLAMVTGTENEPLKRAKEKLATGKSRAKERSLRDLLSLVLRNYTKLDVLDLLQKCCPIQERNQPRFEQELSLGETLTPPPADDLSNRSAAQVDFAALEVQSAASLLPASGNLVKARMRLEREAKVEQTAGSFETSKADALRRVNRSHGRGPSQPAISGSPSLPSMSTQHGVAVQMPKAGFTPIKHFPPKVSDPLKSPDGSQLQGEAPVHSSQSQRPLSQFLKIFANSQVEPADLTLDDLRKGDSRIAVQKTSDLSQESPPAGQGTNVISPEPKKRLLDASANALRNHEKWFACVETSGPEKLLRSYNSHEEVFRFARACYLALFPSELFGASNQDKLLSRISSFIRLNRFENMTENEVISGMKLSDVPWLNAAAQTKKHHPTPAETKKKESLLSAVARWIFNEFLIPLLRTTFYCTETQPHQFRVFYYPRPVWSKLHKVTLNSLVEDKKMLCPISKETAEEMKPRDGKFVYISMRFLPKADGVRPIANLKQRVPKSKVSVNAMLQRARDIFSFEVKENPVLLSSSLLTSEETYIRVLTFVKELKELHGGQLPQLYLVKVDVRKAYDTINQSKLKTDVLRDVFPSTSSVQASGSYFTTQLVRTKLNHHEVVDRLRPKSIVTRATDHPLFEQDIVVSTPTLEGSIVSEGPRFRIERQSEIGLSEFFLEHSVIKDGDSYYRLTKGIPQGSTLSSLFCRSAP
jgi:hypothetical protein